MKKQNVKINSKKNCALPDILIEKLRVYNENYLDSPDNFFTDQNKKDIFLFILEISNKDSHHEFAKMINNTVKSETLSFEGRLQYYLNITIDDFKKYQSNDRIFSIKYANILTTQLQESIKIVAEQLVKQGANVPELKNKLSSFETVLKMLGRTDEDTATSIPIKAYQSFFWDVLIKDISIITEVIQQIVNDVVVLRAKELLNNTQLSDDGKEVVVNKDYNVPIQILYNGENIANEVEIKNIENVIFIEKKDIRTHLNNAIIKLVESGKIKERIVD
jgi:hypothetical protein